MRRSILAASAALILAGASPALAQHDAAQTTANLQGDGADRWKSDPHLHQFYELTKASLGRGTAAVADTARVLRVLGVPDDLARTAAASLDTDGDGRVGEAEIVPAFARYFTVPE